MYEPFISEVFIGDKTHDPRGWTTDVPMEKYKEYSYKRSKYTDSTLYPRNMPVSIVDSVIPDKKL